MNKRKTTIWAVMFFLTIQFIYSLAYVILAHYGSMQNIKLRIGSKGDATVEIWAPYGFVNEDGKFNMFFYYFYRPFYHFERYMYPAVEKEMDEQPKLKSERERAIEIAQKELAATYKELYDSFSRVEAEVKKAEAKSGYPRNKYMVQLKTGDVQNVLNLVGKLDKLYTGIDVSSIAFMYMAFREVNREVKEAQADKPEGNKTVRIGLSDISTVLELVRYYESRAGGTFLK